MTYAAQTNVSVEKSRADIERLLLSKGAGQLMLAFDQVKGAAVVGWTMEGRMVQVSVPQPDPKAAEFTKRMFKGRPTYKSLPADVARARWEQACRARWRSILLILKAKFEAIESGISTVEREFLADTVMANGQTVSRWISPQLDAMYASGRMPALLPAMGETS